MKADWISPFWQAALLPDSWDLCGFVVPSLTVWHTFALENIGNRYLYQMPADRNDAASLLLFASRAYQDGRQLLMPYRRHYRARAMRRIVKRIGKLDWQELDAACKEYVEACLRSASRWRKGNGSKMMAVPYQWHMVARLSHGNPAMLEAAWNTPYAVARCLFDAAAELAGDDSIMSTASQEMEDNWDEYKPATPVEKAGLN